MTTIDEAATLGRELFNSGYYCAESVLMALAEALEISSDLIPRIATGLCSGQSRGCGQCGALSGGILGLGLAQGRRSPKDPVDPIYRDVKRLMVMFTDRFGAVNCRDLIGLDLNSEKDRQRFQTENKHAFCTDITGEAIRMVLEILWKRG
jgi:C_GCAxxG_C_C family probable redox protein